MQSKTILYVEDDAVTLAAYQRLLEQAGFNVETACDGIQALNRLRKHEPDLILLDLVLPKLDGEDVLKFIYGAPHLCQIPVIILSTNTTVSLRNEALVEQAVEHLLKHDTSFPVLLDTINRVLKVAEAAKSRQTAAHKPPACPTENPRILSFLQLNLRGASPVVTNRNKPDLPAATA
ncbi:MAG TPA: response regulator [Candidatus Binatia bacterium]|nr:response regulator [Candidatus Binatia bacterium]